MCFKFLFVVVGLVVLGRVEAVVEQYLQTSVKPCDDFYKYACGNWSVVNGDIDHGDTLSLLDAAVNEKIVKVLESNRGHGVLSKMRTFYKSCRNVKDYNLERFLDTVKPTSGWGVYERSWRGQNFNWLETVAEVRKYSVNIFLEQTVMPKWDNTSVNIIYLDVVQIHPDNRESFLQVFKKTSISKSKTETLADELVSFERQLSDIIPSSAHDPDNEDSEEVVLGYLTESLPQINWVRYLSIVFGKELDLYTPIIIQNAAAMVKLVEFLDKSNQNLVSNYIMVKFLQYVDQRSIDDNSVNECMTALHHSMPLAVGHIVENNFYDPEHDQVVQDLFNFLKVEFLAEVSKLYENQRDVLLFLYTKASVMDLQIGNVKRNLTSEAVSKYYQGLQFSEDQFYRNLLAAFKFKTQNDLASLDGVSDNIAYQWTVTPSPFFVQPKNRIVVPLTLLQDDILGKDSAGRYSVLGFIIGHEFLHGFDVNGVNYDYEGSMVESAISRSPTFAERVQCVEKQLKTKGVGEKIADLGGIRLAFNAFRRSLTQVGDNISSRAGQARSHGESFFIDFAQFFCGVNEKEAKGHSGPDAHETNELRVMQSLMNFEEFSNTFECHAGSPMNPEKKCRVW